MITSAEISNYFKLVKLEGSVSRSDPPYLCGTIPGRIYGGLLVSQAANAFTTLHPDITPHTINYKFVSAGNSKLAIHFKLSSFEDGTVVSIKAYQNGKLVGIGHVRYSSDAELLDSSRFLSPDYGSNILFPSVEELGKAGQVFPAMEVLGRFPVEVRPILINIPIDRTAMWLRIKPEYHDSLNRTDGFIVLMFLSDCTMFLAASEIYQRAGIKINALASLHHTVWVHEAKLDPSGWYLSITDCEVLSHGRALQRSRIFNEERKCVMTVVQEGYLQRAKDNDPKL